MVYFIQGQQTRLVKIGQAADPAKRFVELQVGSAEWLVCLGVDPGAMNDAIYHTRFGRDRVHGEWFTPSPDLMDFIKTLPDTIYTGLRGNTGFRPNPNHVVSRHQGSKDTTGLLEELIDEARRLGWKLVPAEDARRLERNERAREWRKVRSFQREMRLIQ